MIAKKPTLMDRQQAFLQTFRLLADDLLPGWDEPFAFVIKPEVQTDPRSPDFDPFKFLSASTPTTFVPSPMLGPLVTAAAALVIGADLSTFLSAGMITQYPAEQSQDRAEVIE